MPKCVACSPRDTWYKITMTPNMWRHLDEILDFIEDHFVGCYASYGSDTLYVQYKTDALRLKLLFA